jgi:hypothetical protein
MWKNIVEPGKPQVTIWRMCIACWIPKTKNTHSEYVLLLAFQRQESLHERATVLVICTLPVLFEIAVVYHTSPMNPHLPSTDPFNMDRTGHSVPLCGVRNTCSSFHTEQKSWMLTYQSDEWHLTAEAGVSNVDVGPYHYLGKFCGLRRFSKISYIVNVHFRSSDCTSRKLSVYNKVRANRCVRTLNHAAYTLRSKCFRTDFLKIEDTWGRHMLFYSK